MPRSRSISSGNGKPTTPATRNLPSARSTAENSERGSRAMEDLAQHERVMYELDTPFGSDYDCLQGGAGESGHVGARSVFSRFVRSYRLASRASSSFNYPGGSPGELNRLRLNSKDLTTALSIEIWRCCVQKLPNHSHVYQMDAIFCSACRGQRFYV
jgi:hypothetical protein